MRVAECARLEALAMSYLSNTRMRVVTLLLCQEAAGMARETESLARACAGGRSAAFVHNNTTLSETAHDGN
jgi:hypothetical protein